MELEDVLAQPDRWRRATISFFAIFHTRDEVFQPVATPFNAVRHDNLAVWPDGAPVWEERAFKQDFPFLYIERRHPQRDALVGLDTFTRIEITARIRAVYRGRPFLEVLSFRPTGHRLGRQVVQSILAGDRWAEQGDDELAYENYRRALRPDLPDSYVLAVTKRVAEGLRRVGRTDEALALERGGILGGGSMPEARAPGAGGPPRPGSLLGDPLPGLGPDGRPLAGGPDEAPGRAGPLSDDLPGTPYGEGERPAPITDDLPGEPARAAPIADDLPGEPLRPAPIAEDLPGQPVAPPAAEPLPLPAPSPRPRRPAPRVEEAEDDGSPAPADDGPLPGAPPRRAPRLTGVK